MSLRIFLCSTEGMHTSEPPAENSPSNNLPREPLGKPRSLCVTVPGTCHRAVRRIGLDHGLNNADVVVWALELLQRYTADGGTR